MTFELGPAALPVKVKKVGFNATLNVSGSEKQTSTQWFYDILQGLHGRKPATITGSVEFQFTDGDGLNASSIQRDNDRQVILRVTALAIGDQR